MHPQKPISLLTRRAEEMAMTSHHLEDIGIKPLSFLINEQRAIIYVSHTPAVKKLRGTSCGSTYVKGNLCAVYQVLVNNVIVKWFEPYFEQATAKKVH